jgi:DNA-binding protein HU-beta
VNRSELIEAIARHADLSKAAAGRSLDATLDSIVAALRRGEVVSLSGFGSFHVGRRSPRTGRHPRTGDALEIAAANVPKFRAGKALRDAVK